jgi:hypothetical protein
MQRKQTIKHLTDAVREAEAEPNAAMRPSMKVRYIAIYKLHGANRLSEETESVELLALPKPALTATLTTNPEPYFLHVDQSAALGAQLLKGLFAPDKAGTLLERLAAEIEDVKARRASQTGTGVFLVMDGEADIPAPEFKARRDTSEFAICIDAIAKPEIRGAFRPSAQSVLTALGLSLPANADRRVDKIGDVVFLVDPDGGKPIYAFSFRAALREAPSPAR